MIITEFLKTSGDVFRRHGFKQYKKKFIYDHENMYVTFVLSRSYYSESYYLDFNVTIKELHPGITSSEITAGDFDFIVWPRLMLSSKMISVEPDKVEIREYETLLQKGLEKLLKEVNEKGLKLIKDYEKNGYNGVPAPLNKNAQELLRNIRG